jgi:hypothetical protein
MGLMDDIRVGGAGSPGPSAAWRRATGDRVGAAARGPGGDDLRIGFGYGRAGAA